jgi:hypothetical protein
MAGAFQRRNLPPTPGESAYDTTIEAAKQDTERRVGEEEEEEEKEKEKEKEIVSHGSLSGIWWCDCCSFFGAAPHGHQGKPWQWPVNVAISPSTPDRNPP